MSLNLSVSDCTLVITGDGPQGLVCVISDVSNIDRLKNDSETSLKKKSIAAFEYITT